jgi:hypothetical protein
MRGRVGLKYIEHDFHTFDTFFTHSSRFSNTRANYSTFTYTRLRKTNTRDELGKK